MAAWNRIEPNKKMCIQYLSSEITFNMNIRNTFNRFIR